MKRSRSRRLRSTASATRPRKASSDSQLLVAFGNIGNAGPACARSRSSQVLCNSCDHPLPRRPAVGGIDRGRGQHAAPLRGLERPGAPRLAALRSGQATDDLRRVELQRDVDQSLEQRIIRTDVRHDFEMIVVAGVEFGAAGAGGGDQRGERALEPAPILGRREVFERRHHRAAVPGDLHLERCGRRVFGKIGKRLLDDRVEVLATERRLEGGGVKRERRLDRGCRFGLSGVAVEDSARRRAWRAEREQQALDLRAASAALAHHREVEDFAREIGEVERQRQAAEFGDTQPWIIGSLPATRRTERPGCPSSFGIKSASCQSRSMRTTRRGESSWVEFVRVAMVG